MLQHLPVAAVAVVVAIVVPAVVIVVSSGDGMLGGGDRGTGAGTVSAGCPRNSVGVDGPCSEIQNKFHSGIL